ncbi:MAG: alpha/beta hydrolase [Planctomycetes bacterium]|nr:alpha/beta hydrolase [Planctomycetota bacterium]
MRKETLKKIFIGKLSFKRLVRSVVFIYLSCVLIGCTLSDRMIFIPPAPSYSFEPKMVMIETPSGEKICAYYFKNSKARYTLLYSHGNAEDIGQNRFVFERFVNQGFSILAYDYRGYGLSEGKPSAKNAYEDAAAAYAYLTEVAGVPANKIIPYGRSVGGSMAVDIAAKKPVAGLILQNAFTSAYRVLTRIPILPFDKLNNMSKIKKINCPVLIMHGSKDRIIKPWHSRALFKAAKEPKSYLLVENIGHNDDMASAAWKEYWQKIESFMEEVRNADSGL